MEAERCAREQAPLYQLLGLTVADNLDRSIYIKGAKKCYLCNIVYGEIAQFQFDTLRDEYGLLKTRAGRGYEEMIGDEIDSIIIDDSTTIAKLSSTVAGMDQLQPVYYYLSRRVNELLQNIHEINGQIYLFYGKVHYENNKSVLYYNDKKNNDEKNNDKGNIVKILDLAHYLATHKNIDHIGQPIFETVDLFIEDSLKKYLDELIKNNVLRIPVNFRELVEKQKTQWIKNALSACSEFQERAHYLVLEKLVKPVAFNSNGTIQNSTHWSDGLHQFLQLKHELAVTSETLTTNFISNIAYVKRYGAHFCGLTGTLGPAAARENLAKTYRVDCVEIPSVREKQYLGLPTVLTNNHTEWMEEIYFEMQHEVNKDRGVLIICKIIEDVLSLEKFIKEKNRYAKIKIYTMDGCDQEKAIERIMPQEIIIATNLGGRGIDIKAEAINQAGGMHVILTFMPEDRNEKQALYRTARQGNLGSGRKILNKQHLLMDGYTKENFHDLEAARIRYEAKKLNDLFGQELIKIEAKDTLFKKFCADITEFRRMVRAKSRGIVHDTQNAAIALFTDLSPSVYENTVVAAIEERWALFLRDVDDGIIPISEMDKHYKIFRDQIHADYRANTIFRNPYHHITVANDLLLNASVFNDTSIEAMAHFDAAIAKDKQASSAAYVGKAWLYLKSKKSSGSKNYKQLAREAFEQAVALLYDEIAYLTSLHALMQEQGVNADSMLIRQLMQKITLLGTYVNSIEAAIQSIKKSQRFITLTEYANATVMNELERKLDGTIDVEFNENSLYRVQLNDLTARSDMGTVDQAVKSLLAIFKGQDGLNSDYNDLSILVSQADLEQMHLNSVNVGVSLPVLKSDEDNACFSTLSPIQALSLISHLRENNIEFALYFDKLSDIQARSIIKKADLAQEEMGLSIKSLATLFSEQDDALIALNELALRGIEHTLEVNERGFVPWRSMCVVNMGAMVQVAVGSALITTGYGAPVGIALITEGVADSMMSIRAGVSRRFVWNDFVKQKAVSLAISAACLGWQPLYDAGKGMNNLLTGLREEVLEQAGTLIIMNSKTIGRTLVESSRELQILAFKQVGVTVAEAGSREILNHVVDTFSRFSFEQYKSKIASSIQHRIEIKFHDSLLNKIMSKLLTLDQLRLTHRFRNHIDYLIRDILSPSHSFWHQQWNSIGLPLCQGILSAPQYLGTTASMGIRMVGILNGMANIVTVIDHFHEQLLKALLLFDKEIPPLQEQDVVAVDTQSIIDSIAMIMTEHIIMTAETQLVAPITTYAVASGVHSVSTMVQDAIIRSQYTEEMNVLEQKYEALEQKADKTAEDNNEMHALQVEFTERWVLLSQTNNMTYAGNIIPHYADKKSIAHSQCQSAFFATRKSDKSRLAIVPRIKVDEYAEAVQNDKPANFVDMLKMAAENGIQLKIVDDSNYCITQTDKDNNIRVAVFIPGEQLDNGSADVGHWGLMSSMGELQEFNSQNNDCGYAVMAELTGKSIGQLRAETAQAIVRDSDNFYQSIDAQNWIASRFFEARNDFLFCGGTKKDGEIRVMHFEERKMSVLNDAYNASQAVYDKTLTNVHELERIDFRTAKGLNVAIGVYRNRVTGDITIAFEGTKFGVKFKEICSTLDMLPLSVGISATSTNHSERKLNTLISDIKEKYPSSNIVLTGHSKGAAIASKLSHKFNLAAIVFDNPGVIGHEHDFDRVLSIQSTPNIVNDNPLSGPHKGKEVQLKDHAGLFKQIVRSTSGVLCLTASHSLNHIGKLIKRIDKNQRHIREALEHFNYNSVSNMNNHADMAIAVRSSNLSFKV